MLVVKDFIKKYNEQLVLDIKELTIDQDIYWVKGPNGSGKTSFFRSISGIIPCKGSVSINQTYLHKNPTEYRRLINYAEAEPVLPVFLTGYELIAFYADSKRGDMKEVEELIEYFGISGFIQNAIGTYSSGMLKKLSVLLAFIGQPKIILLDEPLITIEDTFLTKIYELIKQRCTDKGITFLISSHQALNEAGIGQYKTLQLANQTITCVG
jgi:ABC-2 type transport system ATP-binding protein